MILWILFLKDALDFRNDISVKVNDRINCELGVEK